MINEELAIPKVEEFLVLVQRLDAMWEPTTSYVDFPGYKEITQAIDERLSLIKAIAEGCDEPVIEDLERGLSGSYGYSGAVSAVTQLLGRLRDADERAAILSPPGPRLSAANMHPLIWGVAGPLWEGGHHPQAVQTAASAIFDSHLPAKLRLQKGAKGTKPEEMVAKAFDDASPMFTIPGYTQGTQDWTNVYQGAKHLGLACAKLVRNLGTHNVTSPGDENELLEDLAMLSRFARIVDSAT